eukprot:13103303-Alexandrium_andersonii.AAC.1
MSASLVGSEMCIRDRSARFKLRTPAAIWDVSIRWTLARPAPKYVKRVNSVSYTHLTLPTICSV